MWEFILFLNFLYKSEKNLYVINAIFEKDLYIVEDNSSLKICELKKRKKIMGQAHSIVAHLCHHLSSRFFR